MKKKATPKTKPAVKTTEPKPESYTAMTRRIVVHAMKNKDFNGAAIKVVIEKAFPERNHKWTAALINHFKSKVTRAAA